MGMLEWAGLGLTAASLYQGYESQQSSEAFASQSLAQGQDAQDFALEQQERALDIYGPIEENLSDYYQSLTPEQFTAEGLDAYEQQFTQANDSWQQQMAQRGLAGSGIEAEGVMQMGQRGVVDRANIVQQAPLQVAQQQLGFLAAGQGQAAQAQQNVIGSMQNSASQLANFSNQQASASATAGAGAGSLVSGMMYQNAYDPNSFNFF